MKKIAHGLKFVLAGCLAMAAHGFAQPKPAAQPPSSILRVAAVQMRSQEDWRANVEKIAGYLADCAARKVQIVAFPECVVSGYTETAIMGMASEDIDRAEAMLAEACRQHRIAVVAGIPARREGRVFNSSVIINADGVIVGRYDKIYLTDGELKWPCARGAGYSPVFPIGDTQASVMICKDSRFPELCRVPVLAGARVVFYISNESALYKESKMGPYRAQVQARAVENNVFVVHANAPADDVRTGSHGQSRIVAPDGNIMQEASQLQEDVLVADLKLSQATRVRALESRDGPFAGWWDAAVKQVRVVK